MNKIYLNTVRKILPFGIIKSTSLGYTKKIKINSLGDGGCWKNYWNWLTRKTIWSFKEVALLIKILALLIEKIGVNGGIHVQLVKGLVDLDKLMADIDGSRG